MQLAGLLHDHAQVVARIEPSAGAAVLLPPLARAFERVARCVRQCHALQARLDRQQQLAAAAIANAERTRVAARRAVIRQMEDAIDQARPDAADTLRDQLYERLEDPALDEQLIARDLNLVVAELRNDLRLPDSFRPHLIPPRPPSAIAALQARAERHPCPPPQPAPHGPGVHAGPVHCRPGPPRQGGDHARPPLPG